MQTLTFDKRRQKAKSCPCGRSNKDGKFIPFTGFEDKGYCHSCGKSFLPKVERVDDDAYCRRIGRRNTNTGVISYMPEEYVVKSMKCYEANDLVSYLYTLFENQKVDDVIRLYKTGTSRDGGAIFWYIDIAQKARSGKLMKYNRKTGKRLKDGTGNIQWAHKLIGQPNYNFKSCLFGEHLLSADLKKPIAIVESEKSAIIGAICCPEFVWVATGGLQNFNAERLQVLKGRKCMAYPDLGAFHLWNSVVERLRDIQIHVSSVLEEYAEVKDKDLKLDIADFLLKSVG